MIPSLYIFNFYKIVIFAFYNIYIGLENVVIFAFYNIYIGLENVVLNSLCFHTIDIYIQE